MSFKLNGKIIVRGRSIFLYLSEISNTTMSKYKKSHIQLHSKSYLSISAMRFICASDPGGATFIHFIYRPEGYKINMRGCEIITRGMRQEKTKTLCNVNVYTFFGLYSNVCFFVSYWYCYLCLLQDTITHKCSQCTDFGSLASAWWLICYL